MVISVKALEYKNGWMKQYTKVNGLITKLKGKEYFGMLKEIFILVTLEMIKQMEMEFINM